MFSRLVKNSNPATVVALREAQARLPQEMSAGVTWNQRNTGGHRSPLQRIRQLQTFQQPARFVRLGARHLVHIGTDIAEIIERRSVLTAAATDPVRWAA